MPWRDRHHHAPGLHEDDLVGHALGQEPWEVLSFPAIAEADEVHAIETIWGPQCFTRRLGEALHPARAARRSAEHPSHDWRVQLCWPISAIPGPLGGGLVNAEWFVFRANEPTAHRTYSHYILTQGAPKFGDSSTAIPRIAQRALSPRRRSALASVTNGDDGRSTR